MTQCSKPSANRATSRPAFESQYPRNDLKVTIDGIATPRPSAGGWLAMTKGTGGNDVMMGDLVLLEDEVNPVMSALLGSGRSDRSSQPLLL
jgi:hypothetical protein